MENFLNLTPFEFEAAWQTWAKHQEHIERAKWERARWQVFKMLTPPKKKEIRMTDLIEFPWDKELLQEAASTVDRFEALKNKWK